MSDDMQRTHEEIKEHTTQIQQLRINAAAAKAETDTRLLHIENGQHDMMQLLIKSDHKQDKHRDEFLKIMADNTAQLNRAQGGIRFGKWLAGVGLTLIGIALAIISYMRG